MGYDVSISVKLSIPPHKVDGALKAINNLHVPESQQHFHYSWVANPGPNGFGTLVEALEAWRYDSLLRNGHVEIMCFTGEKWGDDELLYGAIAPFVQKGSRIECRGEDGCMWAYQFDGTSFTQQEGEVVWK